jgi:hypothetical protein
MNGDFREFRGFCGFCDTAKEVAAAAPRSCRMRFEPFPERWETPNEVRRRRAGTVKMLV